MKKKRPSLGKGLGALLDSAQTSKETTIILDPAKYTAHTANDKKNEYQKEIQGHNKVFHELPIEFIQTGRYQPRKEMDQQALNDLAQSIKSHGVIQPIVVRKLEDKKYELIAGERRWRASQLAGLSTIPVLVKKVSESAMMAMGLIENIQRENLNPIEEANAIHKLKEDFELTQQEIANALGKSRVAVTNLMRLVHLHPDVKTMLSRGDLEMGHARCLLSLSHEKQKSIASTIYEKGLSVRQAENIVRQIQKETTAKMGHQPSQKSDPNISHLEEKLSEKIGSRIQIHQSAKGKGKLTIYYQSLDELDNILDHIQ